MTRDEIMLAEETDGVPQEVRETLRRHGFAPVLDAGNLWFYDRGSLRLTFGEDGSDLPQSMQDECCLFDMAAGSDETLDEGQLVDVLTRHAA
jgi:hypothetical protein